MLETVARAVQSEPLLSLSFLRSRISPDLQEAFVEDCRVCLDCGGKVTLKDDELACTICGRVWSESVDIEAEQIPFEESSVDKGHAESHYSPPSQLAFGKAMGSFLDGRAFFKVLAQAPAGKKDLPLRAMFIRTLSTKIDHPVITSLLSYGSALCYQYGFKSNNDSDQVFSNALGRLLRKVGAYYILRNENGGELKRVCNAVFYIQFCQVRPREAERVFAELHLNVALIHYVQRLLEFLQCPKVQKKTKKPLFSDKPNSAESAAILSFSV